MLKILQMIQAFMPKIDEAWPHILALMAIFANMSQDELKTAVGGFSAPKGSTTDGKQMKELRIALADCPCTDEEAEAICQNLVQAAAANGE